MVLQSSSLEMHAVGRRHFGKEQNKEVGLTAAAVVGVVEQVGDDQS